MTREDYLYLLEHYRDEADGLRQKAVQIQNRYYGKEVFLRGLIEFSNICKNDCYYCGIRKSNKNASRYRLSREEILECCKTGYELGFRTFVLQSGEDVYFTDDILADIVYSIKERYGDCAVTLSVGEKSYESYKIYRDAGTDRYLLRHETANPVHYKKLHPDSMSFENRRRCLYDLKSLGYQVGAGFMVGSPYQTFGDIADDLVFLEEFSPEMVGIGPFIPHEDTRFAEEPSGSVELTLFLLSLIRVMLPEVLLPATTALSTVDPEGREKGILSGANVLMPNLSPVSVRKKYLLYNNKSCIGEEAAECINCLTNRMKRIGYSFSGKA